METPAIDIDKVKHFLQEKENRTREKKRAELNQVIKCLKGLANIWQKYKIRKVYLYGSVVDNRVHLQSDIDIAVEGDLEYRELLRLFGEVDKHLEREIDLRNLDELPFKEIVRKKGVVVYEE